MSNESFAETPVDKTVSQTAIKTAKTKQLERFGSWELVWYLVKRHKFGLVATWAILVTIDHFVPFAKDVVLSVFN